MFYIYDEETKQFNGMVQGQINPRGGGFLQPANSTTIAPPENFSINEVPLFNIVTESWDLGVSQYKKDYDEALLQEENEHGFKIYELVNGVVTARDSGVLQSEIDAKLLADSAEALNDQLNNLVLTMNENILNKAKLITLGSTVESVQAFTQAFTLRANNPGEYLSEGLKVHYATNGYVLGDSLDSEFKIKDYYNKIMIELDKFRELEIANYIEARDLLV